MSRSINSDKSWNSTDEEFDDCDNSSTSNSINRRISGDDIPGGCITTHSVSSVIRPGSKMPRNDPLQFVKIQNNELSKKAVEQIKLAEEVKITKEKIKEVEEEWQNNLLNWKSKRRQSKSNSEDESGTSLASNRKTKTFSEILNEKAKSGHRIGYNLHKYLDGELENENQLTFDIDNSYESNDNDKNSDESYKSENDSMNEGNNKTKNKRSNLGDVIVFDTSLLEEFSYNLKRQDSSEDSSIVNINSNSAEVINISVKTTKISLSSGDRNDMTINKNNNEINNKSQPIDGNNDKSQEIEANDFVKSSAQEVNNKSDKVKVEINDWKHNHQRDNVLMYLLQQEQHQRQHQMTEEQVLRDHNSSYEPEDDDEDEEELERLRLEQEKSFKAKLSAFESLAKQEENNSVNNVVTNNQNNSLNNKLNNIKSKARDEAKRPPPAVQELIHSEQQQLQQRPLYSGQYDDNDNDSEDVVNARIQQLHIERQRVQRQQQQNHIISNNGQQQQLIQQQGVQPLPQQVYQSLNYIQPSQTPSQQLSQQEKQRQFDQQQYFLMDEPIVKQNQTPVRSPKQIRGPVVSPQIQHKQQMPYQQPIQPQEHLYVNQKQLLMNQTSSHPQYYEPSESHERYGSPNREYYDTSYEKPQIQQIPQQTTDSMAQQPQHNQQIPKESSYSSAHNQYLYYPKPYANKSPQQVPIQKPVMVSQQQKQTPNQRSTQQSPIKHVKQQPPTPKQQPHQQTGYNQNHWLLQEAELRRQLASIPTQSSIPSTVAATQRPTTSGSHKTSVVPQKGMLSVSGKKKCSSCGDELGRGCAAMVVESLSLYYHINCFRCSVCNIQLGNGTVGTDVRVRNHKLHCQNCYSNDEAGLKFSRV